MASKPPGTPRLKSHARTSSFDSGSKKCLNGEATHKSIPERRSSRPAHVEKRMLSGRGVEAQDDHSKVKEQLAMIERSKSNLMQDLVRAKRNVEELTTKLNGVNGACKKEKVHAVVGGTAPLEKEGWQIELEAMKQQYDLALLELQTSKQAMESLKHELMVCVEAKDEAVRLAGEAMSAAESTARRVEELSAELFTTKGSALGDDCTTGGMNDLMGDLPGDSLLEIEVPLRSITHKETLIPAGGGSKEGDVTESLITKPPEANLEDEKVQPVQNKEVETKHDVLAFSLKALQRELAAAKEAEKKATTSILSMQADMERARLEAEKFKSAESVAQSSLAKVSRELEEAEKKLAKASIEDATRAESLESFKADLEKSRHEAMQALDRETTARNKATEALDCMEKMREAYQAELLMLKEREASAHATVESLQKDFERQKSESTILAQRELKMRESYQAELSMCKAKEASACATVESLQKDLDRQKSDSSIAAEKELKMRESYQMELSMCKEREASACAMVESLQMGLEKQKAESTVVAAKISEMIKELERSRTELIEQQKHSNTSSSPNDASVNGGVPALVTLDVLNKRHSPLENLSRIHLRQEPGDRPYNYASDSKGAKILASNKEAKGVFEHLPMQEVVNWNTVLTGLIKREHAEEVLAYLDIMKLVGVVGDAVTFVGSLRACGNLVEIEKTQEIQAGILIEGFERGPCVGNILIDTYGRCGLLAEAKAVFEELQHRDVVSWNISVAGYAEHDDWEAVCICLEQMQQSGFSLSISTYTSTLRVCCSSSSLWEGHQLHSELIVKGLESDPLLSMYARGGSITKAQFIFEELQDMRDSLVYCSLKGFSIGQLDWGQRVHFKIVKKGLPLAVTLSLAHAMKQMIRDNALIRNLWVACGTMGASEQRRVRLGEQLYLLMDQLEHDHAGKVAGRHTQNLGGDTQLDTQIVLKYHNAPRIVNHGSITSVQHACDRLITQDEWSWRYLIKECIDDKDLDHAIELFQGVQRVCVNHSESTLVLDCPLILK